MKENLSSESASINFYPLAFSDHFGGCKENGFESFSHVHVLELER